MGSCEQNGSKEGRTGRALQAQPKPHSPRTGDLWLTVALRASVSPHTRLGGPPAGAAEDRGRARRPGKERSPGGDPCAKTASPRKRIVDGDTDAERGLSVLLFFSAWFRRAAWTAHPIRLGASTACVDSPGAGIRHHRGDAGSPAPAAVSGNAHLPGCLSLKADAPSGTDFWVM